MSQENMEIVRRAYDAFERREIPTLHALYDPEVEMDFSDSPFADFANPSLVHGLDEMRRAFHDFFVAFEAVEAEVSELIDAGDHVISVFTYRGRGRESGVATEWKDMAGLWAFGGGKILRVRWLRTRDDALEAVGLRE